MRTADGRWVSAREVWEALLFVKGVELFQLIQRDEKNYDLRILPKPGVRLDTDQLGSALEGLLGKKAKVQQTTVDRIDPEASGKLQLVKSATFEEFRPQSAREKRVPIN